MHDNSANACRTERGSRLEKEPHDSIATRNIDWIGNGLVGGIRSGWIL